MLQNIKSKIYQELEELFTLTAVEEMTGDIKAYKKKLATIGQIAEILGVDTEVTVVSLDLRREGSRLGQNEAV